MLMSWCDTQTTHIAHNHTTYTDGHYTTRANTHRCERPILTSQQMLLKVNIKKMCIYLRRRSQSNCILCSLWILLSVKYSISRNYLLKNLGRTRPTFWEGLFFFWMQTNLNNLRSVYMTCSWQPCYLDHGMYTTVVFYFCVRYFRAGRIIYYMFPSSLQ